MKHDGIHFAKLRVLNNEAEFSMTLPVRLSFESMMSAMSTTPSRNLVELQYSSGGSRRSHSLILLLLVVFQSC